MSAKSYRNILLAIFTWVFYVETRVNPHLVWAGRKTKKRRSLRSLHALIKWQIVHYKHRTTNAYKSVRKTNNLDAAMNALRTYYVRARARACVCVYARARMDARVFWTWHMCLRVYVCGISRGGGEKEWDIYIYFFYVLLFSMYLFGSWAHVSKKKNHFYALYIDE